MPARSAGSTPCPVTRKNPAVWRASSRVRAMAARASGSPESQGPRSMVGIRGREVSVTDVLVPQCGVLLDEVGHHPDALGIVEQHDLHAVRGQPVVAAVEGGGLADDHAR